MATGTIRNNQSYPYRSASQEAGFFLCLFFFFYEYIVYLCTQIAKYNNE